MLETFILLFGAMLLFSLSSKMMMVEFIAIKRVNFETSSFSRRALILGHKYKLMAWAVLTLYLLVFMLNSFLEAYNL